MTTWKDIASIKSKEYVPLGTFWSGDWRVPEDGVYAATIGRDRLELLRKSTYSTSEVLPKPVELTPPTFTRNSPAYLSDGTQVAANVPRFEQGKFGKAILIEEGTTNLVDFDMNFRAWSSNNSNMASLTTKTGRHSFRVQGTSTVPGAYSYIYPAYATTNVLHSASSLVRNLNSKPLRVGLQIRDGSNGGYLSDQVVVVVPPGQELPIRVVSYSPVSLNQVTVAWSVYSDSDDGTVDVEIYMCQLEAKPYATSFIDGTRAAERLTIPTAGVLNPQEGTVEFWVKVPYVTNWNNFFSMGISNGRFLLFLSSDGMARFDYGPNNSGPAAPAGTIEANNWYYIVLRWSATTGKQTLFVNGVKYEKDLPNGVATSFPSTVSVVNNYSAYIDDLRISNRARTDEEILMTYNSNNPAVWDEDTTYLLRFDGNLDSAQQTTTLYNLAKIILTDAGLTEEEYFIDHELKQFPVPYAYFEPQSHREALRKIAEACLGQVYCDREGIIRIEGPSFLQSQTEPVMTITPSDYFRKDNPVKWSEIANYIEVETQPLRPDVVQEVYRSNEPIPITAGQTKTITAYYNYTPCIEATATLENAVSGAQITKVTYYAWGVDITVTSTNTGTFELVINARPLKVLNKEKAIAKDDASIADNGMLKYTFPANYLVQTREVAQKIADTLLTYYKDPRRDVEVEWRGNPALLLGDRIAVVDKDETNEYYVTRQELEFDGALRARLSGRRA